jgi:hypothetical protein
VFVISVNSRNIVKYPKRVQLLVEGAYIQKITILGEGVPFVYFFLFLKKFCLVNKLNTIYNNVEVSSQFVCILFSNPKVLIMASIIKNSMSFVTGTAFGVYLAQNYNVPDVKKLASMAVSMASYIEKANRKPEPKIMDDIVDRKSEPMIKDEDDDDGLSKKKKGRWG